MGTIFPLLLEIKSKTGVLHFRRWRIFSCKLFNIFIHEISKADLDLHLHNHPWNFASIILWGSYIEELKCNNKTALRTHKPFSFAYRTKNQFHKIKEILPLFKILKISIKSDKIYTLFFTGKRRNDDWGYSVNGIFIDNIEYRQMKNYGHFNVR